jgi:hypothetical protein
VSTSNKSFFSGLHLLVTGLAAFVTASVALFGVAVSQGWIGSNATTSGATAAPGRGGPGGGPDSGSSSGSSNGSSSGSSDTTMAAPRFTVDPPSITFQSLGPTTASVKVTNTGTVTMTVEPPTVTGPNANRFNASDQSCAPSVDPGRSCELQVTFLRAAGSFSGTLVVQVEGAVRATEVPIQASAIL